MWLPAIRFLALFMPLLVLACAGPEHADYPTPPAGPPPGLRPPSLRRGPSRLPSRPLMTPDRTPGTGAPSNYAVHGIDVSRWQGAAQAGLPRGAYHFNYFCRPAEEQARWFIQHVPRDPAALPPMLDLRSAGVSTDGGAPLPRRRSPKLDGPKAL